MEAIAAMSLNSPLQNMHMKRSHTQPDEGFSEDMHSQADDDIESPRTKPLSEAAKALIRIFESLPAEERFLCLQSASALLPQSDQLSFVKDFLCTVPTWMKQDVSSHIDSLLYFDPIQSFPYEIIQTIFSHLTPNELLNASAVSRGWREHTQDEELWRYCFKREGWRVDESKLRFVEAARQASALGSVDERTIQRHDSRKRRKIIYHDRLQTDSAASPDSMDGVESTSIQRQDSSPLSTRRDPFYSDNEDDFARGKETASSRASFQTAVDTLSQDYKVRLAPEVWQHAASTDLPKVSWAYLYKQRRLLERNWDNAKYSIFRLPHPKYEAEGHAECVYTIQHIGSVLVSGSRDRSIRVWNLETCRLRDAPLRGHDASVLCLQFDPSPEHDIIVSGGSDSWVIIWRFSTGEIIKKLTTAHTESVLNLRFDDRYIVTCSKDKTIKIWNRWAITEADADLPAHVLPQFTDATGELFVREFSLISTLTGHAAAVNAVMIHNNMIVSASGDRTIKAWSINTGKCERTYAGHTKGIACVQYDGRRIVSGSSDNTVRIFDADKQAEVACLAGHHDLVRTVQARFGDLEIISDAELHAEARRSDARWSKAMEQGAQQASGSRRGKRNAGSSRPEDILTIGARVPPGGGGTKWARIVSGSYDESVIIWKKDRDGKWMPKTKLEQDPWLQHRRHPRPPPAHRPQPPPGQQGPARDTRHQPTLHTTQTTMQTTPRRDHPARPQRSATVDSNSSMAVQAPSPSPATSSSQPQNTAAQTEDAAAAAPAPRPRPHVRAHQHVAANDPSLSQLQPNTRDSNRVFKLQFDARRIVCCSQNRVIMGWDFANGNEDLARVGSWCEETY